MLCQRQRRWHNTYQRLPDFAGVSLPLDLFIQAVLQRHLPLWRTGPVDSRSFKASRVALQRCSSGVSMSERLGSGVSACDPERETGVQSEWLGSLSVVKSTEFGGGLILGMISWAFRLSSGFSPGFQTSSGGGSHLSPDTRAFTGYIRSILTSTFAGTHTFLPGCSSPLKLANYR